MKKIECYYPDCEKKGIFKYGKKTAHFCLCREHFNLVKFMSDMFDYFFENR